MQNVKEGNQSLNVSLTVVQHTDPAYECIMGPFDKPASRILNPKEVCAGVSRHRYMSSE